MGTILLLAGKPPKPGTILAEVADLLREQGHHVDVEVPTLVKDPAPMVLDAAPLIEAGEDGSALIDDGPFVHPDVPLSPELLPKPDLVVHRGLGPGSRAVARYGVTGHELCNPWLAVGQDGDRVSILDALNGAGVPVPLSTRVDTWDRVRALSHEGPIVVKRTRGTGRGREVTTEVGETAPFEGPYVVEPWVPNDGMDRKLYVTGDAVFGLLKPSTLQAEHGAAASPLRVTQELGELALAAADAVGLHLCGVDVVMASRGPVVVDVNPFPGYRGIPGAARAVAEHLLSHL